MAARKIYTIQRYKDTSWFRPITADDLTTLVTDQPTAYPDVLDITVN